MSSSYVMPIHATCIKLWREGWCPSTCDGAFIIVSCGLRYLAAAYLALPVARFTTHSWSELRVVVGWSDPVWSALLLLAQVCKLKQLAVVSTYSQSLPAMLCNFCDQQQLHAWTTKYDIWISASTANVWDLLEMGLQTLRGFSLSQAVTLLHTHRHFNAYTPSLGWAKPSLYSSSWS